MLHKLSHWEAGSAPHPGPSVLLGAGGGVEKGQRWGWVRERGTWDVGCWPRLGWGACRASWWRPSGSQIVSPSGTLATRLGMSPSPRSRPPQASQSPPSKQRPVCPVFLENEYAMGILGKDTSLYLETKPPSLEGYRMHTAQDRHVLLPASQIQMPGR